MSREGQSDEKAQVEKCSAQTYRLVAERQRVEWCNKDATAETRAMDDSLNLGCDDHAEQMIEAGAVLVRIIAPRNPPGASS